MFTSEEEAQNSEGGEGGKLYARKVLFRGQVTIEATAVNGYTLKVPANRVDPLLVNYANSAVNRFYAFIRDDVYGYSQVNITGVADEAGDTGMKVLSIYDPDGVSHEQVVTAANRRDVVYGSNTVPDPLPDPKDSVDYDIVIVEQQYRYVGIADFTIQLQHDKEYLKDEDGMSSLLITTGGEPGVSGTIKTFDSDLIQELTGGKSMGSLGVGYGVNSVNDFSEWQFAIKGSRKKNDEVTNIIIHKGHITLSGDINGAPAGMKMLPFEIKALPEKLFRDKGLSIARIINVDIPDLPARLVEA